MPGEAPPPTDRATGAPPERGGESPTEPATGTLAEPASEAPASASGPLGPWLRVEGVELARGWSWKGVELRLLGAGARTYSIFGVKIYVAGLYVAEGPTDADALIAADTPRVIVLHAARAITAPDVARAWAHAFEQNCAPLCPRWRAVAGAFLEAVPPFVPGDVYVYGFDGRGRVEVTRNGERWFAASSPELERLLLATWLGPKPPTYDLKRALLGQKR